MWKTVSYLSVALRANAADVHQCHTHSWLDFMILEVFSNLNDSVIPSQGDRAKQWQLRSCLHRISPGGLGSLSCEAPAASPDTVLPVRRAGGDVTVPPSCSVTHGGRGATGNGDAPLRRGRS